MALPVVLVHGGGHGAWCWAPLLEHLAADGLAVDLPPKAVRGGAQRFADLPELRTLTVADFATSVLADVATVGWERFVLVGHSLAGITIPEVAARAPGAVAHLVFVSCAVPPEGGSVIDALQGDVAEMARANLAQSMARPPSDRPTGPSLPEEMLRHMFGTGLDDEQMQLVLDHFGNEVMGIMAEPISRADLPAATPKTWVRLVRDAVVSLDEQAANVAHLEASPGGTVEVVDLDAGHDAMISHPRELAAVIDRIATAAG